MKYVRIAERPVPDKPLGRHVRHDPRSKAYPAAAGPREALVSVRHDRYIPVLIQRVGSCTGNSAEGAAGSGSLYLALPADLPARPTGDADLDEEQAEALYSRATQLDGYPGEWPPTDTGSDGLSVAKAAQEAGLISGYRHAFSLDAALTALAEQPVITGISWYSTFDEPDREGLIEVGRGAYVRGGHEVVADELDVENRRVGITNSWGEAWGLAGRAYLSWDTWGRLLSEQGDVTVFVPLDQPAPTPAPDPSGCAGQVMAIVDRAVADIKQVLGL